jgi:hypothetical protein
MKRLFGAALIAAMLFAGSARAQEDEIVVTATRYREAYEDFQIPHVSVLRRADFVVAMMVVESDTRDLGQRRTELMETLTELGRRARAAGSVTVALLEESEEDGASGVTRVKDFSVEAARDQISGGNRPDTSRVSVLLRTRVAPQDTLAGAVARIDGFVRGLPKPGRVTLGVDDPELTVVNPAQYRADIVAAIAADARRTVEALGAGQAVRIEGLENRVAWQRAGDLDLRFYIPHRLAIVPAGAVQ